MQHNGFSLEVLMYGEPSLEYEREGRMEVPAWIGSEYSLRLRVPAGDRMRAVVSVDGLNVLTGRYASPRDEGLAIEAGEGAILSGFNACNGQIVPFKFIENRLYYGEFVDRPLYSGVIKATFFRQADAPGRFGDRLPVGRLELNYPSPYTRWKPRVMISRPLGWQPPLSDELRARFRK